jgi:glycosyltransferase involved in cell wall biosynthesis
MVSVLHVTLPTEAGVAAYVAALCADQQARGWDVTVACPDRGRLPGDLAARGIRRVGWQAGRSPGAGTTAEVRRLGRLLDGIGPDVLHLHSSKAGLAGRLATRGRLPTIFQPHGWSWLATSGPMVGITLAWERLAARWTTLFLCVGEDEAAQGRAHGLRGRYCVVRNGVDLTRFAPADESARRAARVRLGIVPSAPLVVYVGRVTRQKGPDRLLAAWAAVHARHPAAALAVVGTGDLLEPLRRQAPPGVIFAGGVDDPRPWYTAADLVVLPSRWEGLPLTLLEAQATGRPVVGTDIPGIAEALPPEAGALVPAGDGAALAEAIGHRLGNLDLARAEGWAAARYAAANADVRHTYDRLARVTEELAGSRRRARTAAGKPGPTRDSPYSPTHRAGSSR